MNAQRWFRSILAVSATAFAAFASTVCLAQATPTTTNLTLGPSSTVKVGTSVTLTASVADTSGKAVRPGLVTFCDANAPHCEGAAVFGRAQLTFAGSASIHLRLGIGSYSFKAEFHGITRTTTHSTTLRAPSESTAVALTVKRAAANIPTTSAISVSGALGVYNFTGTVAAPGKPSATGTVSFLDSAIANASLGSASLSTGAYGLLLTGLSASESGFDPTQVVAADLNRDGIPDLIVSYLFNSSITILIGKGDGTFTPMSAPNLDGYAGGISVADFNSDGIPDIAVGLSSPCCAVALLFGKGDGTFVYQSNASLGSENLSVTTGDFNGDGIVDLAATNNGSSTISLGLGSNDGEFFLTTSIPVSGNPSSIASGDFNGDGLTDLAVTIGQQSSGTANTVSILLSNGDGTFTTAASPTVGNNPGSIVAGDFNGDGILDLAVSSSNDGTVTILLGNGDGSFVPQPGIHTGHGTNSLSVTDFNGDGISDIAVGVSDSGIIKILLGKGNSAFTIVQPSGANNYASSLATADLNGDGIPDLATTINSDAPINILLAQPTTAVSISGVSLDGGGIHKIVASYSGDSLYQASVSAPISLNNTTAAPTVFPGSGGYAFPLSVNIADPTPGAAIYYTLDGTTPGAGSTLYTGPIVLTASGAITVRAIAIAPHFAPSTIVSATYVSALPTAITLGIAPGASVAAGTPATLSAYVTANGVPFHDGNVLFCKAEAVHCEDSALLGSAQIIAGGWAKLRLRLGIGTYSIRAVFEDTPGSATPRIGSTSTAQTLTVKGKIDTITTSISAVNAGGVYTLTSRVNAFGRAPISGSLSFTDSINGSAPVSLGSTNLSPTNTVMGWSPSALTPIGNDNYSFAVGDFNRDGIPDMVITNYLHNSLSILLGNGNGTFTVSSTLPADYEPDQVAVADFNRDGIADIAVTYRDAGNVAIMLGKPDGTFSAANHFTAGRDTQEIVIADFNRDGILDIVTGNISSRTVSTLIGNGDGTFAAPINLSIPSEPFRLAVGDFNRDGVPDLAVSTESGISTLLGSGDGSFIVASTLNIGDPIWMAAADYNGDGVPDLAVIVNSNSYPSLSIYLANGDGTFTLKSTPITSSPTTPQPATLAVADFNGDGIPDLAVSEYTYPEFSITPVSTIRILLGAGDGTFPRSTTPRQNSIEPLVADFNSDGIPDILTESFNNQVNTTKLGVLLGVQVTTGAIRGVTLPATGTHSITAGFSGNGTFDPSSGPPLTINVAPPTPQ